MVKEELMDKKKQMDKMQLLLRPAEAAEALGVSRSRCYELIKEGGIPSMRIGTAVRVPRVALEQWVASRVKAHEADGQ